MVGLVRCLNDCLSVYVELARSYILLAEIEYRLLQLSSGTLPYSVREFLFLVSRVTCLLRQKSLIRACLSYLKYRYKYLTQSSPVPSTSLLHMTMTVSRGLLDLPVEVRLLIYDYLFVDASAHLYVNRYDPLKIIDWNPQTSILQACRQLRNEAFPR